jgi:hypothetical protein
MNDEVIIHECGDCFKQSIITQNDLVEFEDESRTWYEFFCNECNKFVAA